MGGLARWWFTPPRFQAPDAPWWGRNRLVQAAWQKLGEVAYLTGAGDGISLGIPVGMLLSTGLFLFALAALFVVFVVARAAARAAARHFERHLIRHLDRRAARRGDRR